MTRAMPDDEKKQEALRLARHLAKVVDAALVMPRLAASPPTDGQVAVMAIFDELERMGFKLTR